jgi:Domain of unknown function (DUF4386)
MDEPSDTQQLQTLAYKSSACTTRDISLDWCFSIWGRRCSLTCGSSRATSLDGWAALGIFSSLLVAIVTLAIMVFPGLAAVVDLVYFAPIFIFEVTMGFWLLIKGIKAPIVE